MDWSLLVFVLVVIFFAYRGYRNGMYKSMARVLSILAGYACAILFNGQMAAVVESNSQWSGVMAFVIAGLILFIGASVTVTLLFWLIGYFVLERGQPSTLSAIGGTAVGSLVGVLIAIIVVWTWAFVRDMQPVASAAPTAPSRIEMMANQAAGHAVNTAMTMSSAKPEVAGLSAALMSSPAEVAQRARRLMQSDELIYLLNHPESQRVLSSGNYAAVQNLPAFQTLMVNPDLRSLAGAAGVDTDDPRAMQAIIAQQLTDTWNRAQQVKHHPRVREILADPEFQRQLDSGNPLSLIGDSRLHELANIVFADNAPAPAMEKNDNAPAPPKKIYNWTDSSGQLHISTQEPEN